VKSSIYGLFVIDDEEEAGTEDKIIDMMSFSYDVAILKRHLKEFQEEFTFPIQYIIKEVCTYRAIKNYMIESSIIHINDNIYAFYRGVETCLLFVDPRHSVKMNNKSEKVAFDTFYDEGIMNA
jgi:sulfate adenylyltransferase subunit 1 (EFTu-like GTPase family)